MKRPDTVSSHPKARYIMWMPEMENSWVLIDNTQEAIDKAIASGAMYLTNCAFSEPPLKSPEERKDLLNLAPVRYGHLHFDLDAGTDQNKALRELRLLINNFHAFGLSREHILLWFSGSKGFHARVSCHQIGPEASNGDRFLPLIYKRIAAELAKGLTTWDPSIYCMGFGRQYRIPGVLRAKILEEKGFRRHKIPVTYDEVMDDIEGLSIEEFQILSQEPREL